MLYIKKYKFVMVIFLLAVLVLGVFVRQWRLSVQERERIQTLKHAKEPDLLTGTFLRYLQESKIEYAKELVIPEQRERIDKWVVESNHKSFDCPYNWKWIFSQPVQIIASGSGSSVVIDENTFLESESNFCNFSENSIAVYGVIVHYDGFEWVITDWREICETTPFKAKTCYQ